jgi:two-component system chemotaxis response regulator CheY
VALNILIVDDSDLVRTVIGRTLSLAGIPIGELYEAGNGREALDVIEDRWVDLILADLNMPVMGGLEMLAKLREDGVLKTIPVIVVSTEGSATRVEELTAMGVAAYVRKPFTPELIRDVVSRALGQSDTTDHSVVLGEVFRDVLERFAFMFGETAAVDDLGRAGDVSLAAKIAFNGELAGNLTLVVPADLCPEIAANVLGIDAGDELIGCGSHDALREMANITCGCVLTALAGDTPVFDLSVPVVSSCPSEEWDALLDARGTAGFLVEERPVLLNLDVRCVRA